MIQSVLVTGGAGYVGAVLVPKLLNQGYQVTVVDTCYYGDDVFSGVADSSRLNLIKADIRDQAMLKEALQGVDAVVHLACISNDPSFELDPELGKSINFDAFEPLVQLSVAAGVKRFIYASSSSVYGIKDEPEVTEALSLEPLTDYSKYKALCEDVLAQYTSDDFTTLTVRPATVCGYSPRQRLDVVVNILTNHAYHNRKIKIFGGDQHRPNIHIEDMANFYIEALKWPHEKINGKIYNVGLKDHTVKEIARIVQSVMGEDVTMETVPSDDNRSYRVSSEKIKRELGFEPAHSLEDAVRGLKQAFEQGKLPNAMEDPRYFNIKTMQEAETA